MSVLLQPNSFQLAITSNGSDDFIVLNFGKLYNAGFGIVRYCNFLRKIVKQLVIYTVLSTNMANGFSIYSHLTISLI